MQLARTTAPLLGMAALAALGTAALPQAAHAQANLTFSGGSGKPLTLTLSAPVTYLVTTAPTSGAPVFDFQGVGNVFDARAVSGTLTFTINGGKAQTFTGIGSGFAGGSVAANDATIFGPLPGVAVGDIVVLNAGMLMTSSFAGAAPASRSYQTFLVDGGSDDGSGGNKLDAVNGVSGPAAAPEPSQTAALGLGVLGLAGLALKARRRLIWGGAPA